VDFNPQQQHSLLKQMGYDGPTDPKMMEAFLSSNPGAAARMGKFSRVVKKRAGMAEGGTVKKEELSAGEELSQAVIRDPGSLVEEADVAKIQVTPGTLIDRDVGQVRAAPVVDTATVAKTEDARAPRAIDAATVRADTAADNVRRETNRLDAEQGTVSGRSQVRAAQEKDSSLEGMQAAQGVGILMNNPVQRQIEEGELISGSTVDASKVNSLVESIQAAEATPTKQATVQGQLEGLMQQFEGGNTPAWAAGAMRAANAALASRGLGASSMAGQAVIQAAMESALPIAQVDASTFAQFEGQNLSNRQQTALFAAQQRASFLGQEFDQNFQTRVMNAAKVSDIANMNFTAEQNIAMENSRIVNTVNLENLSNRQAMTMAQAAALANLDMANLSNRQQAAVQNAQAFLQMDMANLDNRQQTSMFRAQSNVQALFTDQAAVNAARQFNASSENQTNQFFADLSSRVGMFNAEQGNAMRQFNAGETNTNARFNAQLRTQRDQFNATNSLVIAQANAQWRQNVATINTAAQNTANLEAVRAQNGLTTQALDNIWQNERDTLSFAFQSYEAAQDRATQLLLADKAEKASEAQGKASFFFKMLFG
jgi:hypothetical protein